jgi:betaine-homocysteine S-methyltransferase
MGSKGKGILERLAAGPVLGDGGFVFALEKRGYVKAGPWTPEATVEHPEAVRQLHTEFARAGADVMQTFTFYASDDKLQNRGNQAQAKYSGAKINQAACDLAREVASEHGGLVAGGICQTPTYLSGIGKAAVQDQLQKQLEVFVKNDVDFLICEYFEHIEEMEWAIEVALATGKPVAATMCIGPDGDMHGVTTGDCGVRMAKAGAHIVGINCHFDPDTVLAGIKKMKDALDGAGLKPFLMSQPLGYHTPDCNKQGFIDLPEFPFALEPRILTRWEMHKYARDAYNLGVRLIGGCCGFEPYHVRAVAEELAEERGCQPKAAEKHAAWGGGLKMHTKPWVRARARRDYWENIVAASGRPYNPSLSKPDAWGVTAGDSKLIQQAGETSDDEIKKLSTFKAEGK